MPQSEPLIERLVAPLRRFISIESSSGIMLLVSAAIALVWANSPWADAYRHLWALELWFGVGEWGVRSTLHAVINDGLMAIFFFVVGLEIKREFLAGELKSRRTAALPIIAAFGGMIVPAGVYALFNHGGAGAAGWGVPMATDIAFALGVLTLLGDRVPAGLKVFLVALAIVDDIGAVLVIALFYSAGVSLDLLGLVAVLLATAAATNLAGVRHRWAYALLGVALWAAVLVSGVHATVAGVLLAMTIPVRTRIDESAFLDRAQSVLKDFHFAAERTAADPETTVLSNTEHHAALEELELLTESAQPPLIRIERSLRGIVAFGIIPLFALANAGVSLSGDAVRGALANPITLGVAIGLIAGKLVGISFFSWIAVRVKFATLPNGVSWPMILGTSVVGGVGFTMALFIAELAFGTDARLEVAKLGILAASVLSGVVGWLLLRALLPPSARSEPIEGKATSVES